MTGYVRIHRSLLGHPAFRNESETMAFAWMVARASWQPARVRYKGQAVSLGRGQLCISQRDMATAFDRDKSWIERLWKRLVSEAMIEARREAAAMVITICNYDKYQQGCVGHEAEHEALASPYHEAAARQVRGTEQRREKENKEEDISVSNETSPALKPEHVVDAWNDLARRIGRPTVRALTPERRSRVRARIAGYSLDDWRAVLEAGERSPFLRGDTGWSGFTFDWLTKKANFQKVLEGNYDEQSSFRRPTH